MSKPIKQANAVLELHLRELGFDTFVREYRFAPPRRWRFDYLLSEPHDSYGDVAIEIEGGIWNRGRHTRGAGYQADLEKYRVAAAMTFKVFRFSTQEVLDGTAKAFIGKHCEKPF